MNPPLDFSDPLPRFDIRDIPFSRRGSWLNLSPVVELHRTARDVHLVSHVTGMHAVLALRPLADDDGAALDVRATPAVLEWMRGDDVVVSAAFATPTVLRVRGGDVGMVLSDVSEELTPFTGSYLFRDPVDGSAVFTSYESGRRYRVTSLAGTMDLDGDQSLGAGTRRIVVGGGNWEIAVEEIETARQPFSAEESFDDVVVRSAADFAEYLDAVAPWRTDETPAAALAVYVLWSATVDPAGFVTRESILMSKHWMDKIWSWDHCFNAIALVPGRTTEGLDQFLAPFDHQDPAGALPDSITHSEVLYNFVKPPIHGWAFRRMREAGALFDAVDVATVYERLVAWTEFWLDRRTAPGHRLPHYQHGNDSGWDNSTMFDHDRLIEAPDLAAFLVVQLDVLADLADELGRDGAQRWRSVRNGMRSALLAELLDDVGFFARSVRSGRASKRTSLLPALVITAAEHLPDEVRHLLVAHVEAHLTPWGLATQRPDSSEYEADGYWRGPIWAPSTVLVEDGLRRAGFADLADTVSARFRALCEASGFAENFDALTGKGLRDRAYTWTASAYLMLARDHLK
ncbi:trehalase family glycosidase [Microbacterium shaanxiense]